MTPDGLEIIQSGAIIIACTIAAAVAVDTRRLRSRISPPRPRPRRAKRWWFA